MTDNISLPKYQSNEHTTDLTSSDEEIKTTIMSLPDHLLCNILKQLPFTSLKLFTEHKVNVLKKPLTGGEDRHRLMIGEIFIFHEKDFLDVVKQVYNFALCCKTFYLSTQRERKLLTDAANWSKIDRTFFIYDDVPLKKEEDKNIQFENKDFKFFEKSTFMPSVDNLFAKPSIPDELRFKKIEIPGNLKLEQKTDLDLWANTLKTKPLFSPSFFEEKLGLFVASADFKKIKTTVNHEDFYLKKS